MIEPIRIEVSLDVMFPSVNCYLVPGTPLTLIDCGIDSLDNWETLQNAVEANGYKISDIEQIIITHEHRDHIGMLPRLMKETSATVRAPKMIEGWFSRPDQMKKDYTQFLDRLLKTLGFPVEKLKQCDIFLDALRRFPTFEKMERFEFFEEGDFLSFGNTKWEVLNTPGHCPTQHVFLQKEEKRIFSSDMILPITPMPIITENKENPNQPLRALRQLLDSFERLRPFDIQKIYPGHGAEFNGVNETIDKQLARINMRKEECLEAVKSGLKTPYDINRKMYPYQMIPPDFSGMYMVLGYLDLLEEAGSVTKTLASNGHQHFKGT